MEIVETKLVLWAVDLAGYTRACAHLDALSIARFLDAWYGHCGREVRDRGGRVVKFMGDACFAVFPEDRVTDAIDAATALVTALGPLRAEHGWRIDLGANVHLAIVAAGDLGDAGDRRYDVIGSGVNHLFRMGAGPGVRISEPIFRQLPNDRRGAWRRERPPAMYTLAD
jgi:class 3 adenylate cyclase